MHLVSSGECPRICVAMNESDDHAFNHRQIRRCARPDLRWVPEDRRGEALIRHFTELWEHNPGYDTLVFHLRTAVTNEAVAAQFQAKFNELIVGPVSALWVDGAAQRSAFIGAQILGIALCRYVLHLEPLASLSVEDAIAGAAPALQLHLAP